MNADSGAIPIRNVYALLAYAWDFLELASPTSVGAVDADTPADLLARVLVDGLQKLLRRGPYRAYVERAEDLRLPRGAVDVTRTVTGALRASGRVACRLDELSYDVPQNRAVKAAARALIACRSLDRGLAASLKDSCVRMNEVVDVALSAELMRQVHVPRGHRAYGPLLDVCRLVLANLLPEETGDGLRLRDFTRDDEQMAHLFEAFVRGFLQHHLGGARVRSEHVGWAAASGEPEALGLLPRMITDASVRTPGHCAILETKFVRRPFRELEGGSRLKLRSEHLYQLFAYLKNTHERAARSTTVDGVLVYAGVGRGMSRNLVLGDNRVFIRTLDLTASWPELRAALLRLPVQGGEVPGAVA